MHIRTTSYQTDYLSVTLDYIMLINVFLTCCYLCVYSLLTYYVVVREVVIEVEADTC